MSRRQKKIQAENSITYQTTNDAVIYIRVCCDETVRDTHTLKSQGDACCELCAQRGWTVIAVFADTGVSGWSNAERPEFEKMMEFIENKRNVNLVVFDYSLIGRRSFHTFPFLAKMDFWGVNIVSARQPTFDSRTASGRFVQRVVFACAEEFFETNPKKRQKRMRNTSTGGQTQ
jgi:site-specific DNA recombinase